MNVAERLTLCGCPCPFYALHPDHGGHKSVPLCNCAHACQLWDAAPLQRFSTQFQPTCQWGRPSKTKWVQSDEDSALQNGGLSLWGRPAVLCMRPGLRAGHSAYYRFRWTWRGARPLMASAGAPLQGYSTGKPATAGPDSIWAAPQQGGPGRCRFFRIDSALALPAKLYQRRLTAPVAHGSKHQPRAIRCPAPRTQSTQVPIRALARLQQMSVRVLLSLKEDATAFGAMSFYSYP
ncbi:hypothetical protein NDU88_003001 [Pleurodeles waltl]|uniref:Uncharacterized protein n=1 Tax=Pleurodeles waltl TaxID=8319 RepID=A0AAV7W4E2_PLEWA|nr:hypothetical protein NDU88_003001 [Pleurodeles waltl]